MKKKKLKKKVKKLRKDITYHRKLISNLGDKYVKLRTDLTKLQIENNCKKTLNFGFDDPDERIVDELRKEADNGS